MNHDDRIIYRKPCKSCGGSGGTRKIVGNVVDGVACIPCAGLGYVEADLPFEAFVNLVIAKIGGDAAGKIEDSLTREVRDLLTDCRDEMTRFMQQIPEAFTAHTRKKMGERLSRINNVLSRLG